MRLRKYSFLPFYWSSADQLALPTHVQTWGGKLSGEGREGRRGEEGRRREREGGEKIQTSEKIEQLYSIM